MKNAGFTTGLLLTVCFAVLCNTGYGIWRIRQVDAEVSSKLEQGRTIRLAILQGAVPAGHRRQPERFGQNLNSYKRLMAMAQEAGPVDLVIWPETTYERVISFDIDAGHPVRPRVAGKEFSEAISQDINPRSSMLLGAYGDWHEPGPSGNMALRRHNVALGISADGQLLGMAAKRYLIPFGEFVPFAERFPFLYRRFPGAERLSAGKDPNLIRTEAGAKLGILICYEDIITGAARSLSAMGAQVLVNLTSDAGLGSSKIARHQHLRLSALRAIENRRFLVRAVNGGISAIIDPAGRVLKSLAPEEESFLIARVPLFDEVTFHAGNAGLFYRLGASWLVLQGCLALLFRIRHRGQDWDGLSSPGLW